MEPNYLDSLEACQVGLENDLAEWIDALHQADQTFYDMMSLEIWSITQTMDEIMPGFWGRYMANRQAIVREYIEERRHRHLRSGSTELSGSLPRELRKSSHRPLSPFASAAEGEARTSYFSGDFSLELIQLHNPTQANIGTEKESSEASSASGHHAAVPFTASSQTDAEFWPDLILSQPETPTTSPDESASSTASALSFLPHLRITPTVKAFSEASEQDPYGLVRLAIACWLTPHFWITSSDQHSIFALQPTEEFILEPNQSVICALGFRLNGIASPVKVQLARSLRRHTHLSATWMADLPRIPTSLRRQIDEECAIQLHNRDDKPCSLQAGKPFCRLEFYWSAATA